MKSCPFHIKSGIAFIVLIVLMMALVVYHPRLVDGFENKKEPAVRCGVDLPSCVGEHVRCMNGYCMSDITPLSQ